MDKDNISEELPEGVKTQHSVTGVTNELSGMIEKLPKNEQKRILNVVRALAD